MLSTSREIIGLAEFLPHGEELEVDKTDQMSRSRLIKHSAAGQALGYFYNDEEPHHRSVQAADQGPGAMAV